MEQELEKCLRASFKVLCDTRLRNLQYIFSENEVYGGALVSIMDDYNNYKAETQNSKYKK